MSDSAIITYINSAQKWLKTTAHVHIMFSRNVTFLVVIKKITTMKNIMKKNLNYLIFLCVFPLQMLILFLLIYVFHKC